MGVKRVFVCELIAKADQVLMLRAVAFSVLKFAFNGACGVGACKIHSNCFTPGVRTNTWKDELMGAG